MAISFASGRWPYWGSAVIYPVIGPDVILNHPSRLSRISPAALLVILPMRSCQMDLGPPGRLSSCSPWRSGCRIADGHGLKIHLRPAQAYHFCNSGRPRSDPAVQAAPAPCSARLTGPVRSRWLLGSRAGSLVRSVMSVVTMARSFTSSFALDFGLVAGEQVLVVDSRPPRRR